MHQQPDQRARHEFGTKSYNLHQAGSQGWRYGIGDNILSPNVLSRSTLSVASSNPLNFGGQMSEMLGSVRIQEHGGVASSIARPTMGEHLMQDTQRDQIGSSNIYPAELHGVPHYGTTSPFVLSEEPVYVNAKQYHAILRRRQLRAKAEMENKLTRVRKPYLHESRHLHALRRARGCGGRFVNTKKSDTSTGNATHEEGNSISDSPRMTTFSSAPDSRYASTDSSGLVETSTGLNEFRRLSLQGTNHPEFFQWDCHKRFLSK